jgi:hypothetical protein
MKTVKQPLKAKSRSDAPAPVNQGRHEARCSICSHPEREQIEQEFVAWASPAKIAQEHSDQQTISRDSVYRHAHALGLMEKRRRNVRAALERIIEKAGDVEVNAASVVGAVSAYARINSRGEWVERTETVNLAEMFQRMTPDELDNYAKTGVTPEWFKAAAGATPADSPRSSDER